MSLLKKIFGTLTEKPWEASQAAIDSTHAGKTFEISNQMSAVIIICLLYTSPSPRDATLSRMPSSA